ncbi:thermonuclease family protein [Microbaculum marinum]|uniref:Thermonuclease family protein n=1 Tax=Microbaculum marinum TaxID=1764581 RepID=A0AAW9RZW7_9HYPH
MRSRSKDRRTALTRVDDFLTALVVVAFMVLVLAYLPSGAPRSYSGAAHVIDGDSLVVGTVKTRLTGIDAPEMGQMCRLDGKLWRCGEAARSALHEMIAGRDVTCEGEGRDVYGRVLAVCSVGGTALNERMVRDGWAVAYGGYAAQERIAKAGELGLWRSEFERPALWREMFRGT